MKNASALLAAALMAMASVPPLTAQTDCERILAHSEKAVDYQELSKVASGILEDDHPQPSEDCIAQALFILGRTHSAQSVPLLLKWITWEKTSRFKYRLDTPSDKYPAISALFDIGKPAEPFLEEVIRSRESDDASSKNALEAFMSINRDDPMAGIQKLRNDASSRRREERDRLLHAAARAQAKWCVHRTDCR